MPSRLPYLCGKGLVLNSGPNDGNEHFAIDVSEAWISLLGLDP